MRPFALYILLACIGGLYYGCYKDKYTGFSGDVILKGSAYIVDSTISSVPVPLAGRRLFLATDRDTSTYLYQCNTDSAGQFIISSLKDKSDYTLFTHFVGNGTEYAGAISFTAAGSGTSKTMTITLDVTPHYQNGMSILITDIYGGPLSNLPFRIYTSRLIALVDSTQYAYVNSKTNANGRFAQYNIPTGWYYIVSKDTVSGNALKVFDSVNVLATGIAPRTPVLH